jgi:hypothetical protein
VLNYNIQIVNNDFNNSSELNNIYTYIYSFLAWKLKLQNLDVSSVLLRKFLIDLTSDSVVSYVTHVGPQYLSSDEVSCPLLNRKAMMWRYSGV